MVYKLEEQSKTGIRKVEEGQNANKKSRRGTGRENQREGGGKEGSKQGRKTLNKKKTIQD